MVKLRMKSLIGVEESKGADQRGKKNSKLYTYVDALLNKLEKKKDRTPSHFFFIHPFIQCQHLLVHYIYFCLFILYFIYVNICSHWSFKFGISQTNPFIPYCSHSNKQVIETLTRLAHWVILSIMQTKNKPAQYHCCIDSKVRARHLSSKSLLAYYKCSLLTFQREFKMNQTKAKVQCA